MSHIIGQLKTLLIASALLLLTACGTLPRLDAVPEDQTDEAVVPSFENVRFSTKDGAPALFEMAMEALVQEREALGLSGSQESLPPAHLLALSGGGDNGAFGAGILTGWSTTGERPEFKVVSGVSTGALIAPFAFLGLRYDDQLTEVYTTVEPKDIYRPLGLLRGFFGDAFADTSPLWDLVQKYANRAMLDAIAREYDKGRILLMATTNLDSKQPVLWDMGAIAKIPTPAAVELFQSVLLASASIPGVFPPVMIDVEVGGKRYQEMHVDGGVSAQVYAYPPSMQVKARTEEKGLRRERILYVIRNGKVSTEWQNVDRDVLAIASGAITALIVNQGIGDIYTIYLSTRRDKMDFNLAYIPDSFDAEHPEEFDRAYMNELYDLGHKLGREGYPWEKLPPGFTENQ